MNINDLLEHNAQEINEFIEMSHNAAARADYIQGGGGNTSVKLKDGLMAIKASGFSMGQITKENAYAVLNYPILVDLYKNNSPQDFNDPEAEGSRLAKEATLGIEGLPSLRPSVEAGFHSILGGFVLHSHAVYANLLGCSASGKELMEKAFEGAEYTAAFVPYVNPGAVLTFVMNQVLEETKAETGKVPALLIMENHGIVAHGDTAEEAERIHDDANERIAGVFGVSREDFPSIAVAPKAGGFVSATPWLKEKLKTGDYTPAFFMEQSLYPDQLVFLAGNLAEAGKDDTDKKASIDLNTGDVYYNCNESEALVIEQTLCCVIFIVENIKKRGYALKTMDSEGKDFIAGWESESYRKSLLEKK